ncbi:MAG TPA: methionine biosynthesis protein MetW [Jiangellales bacterium]|nr:methionine biosynthesis protein MetW [Jiangellales bacterium]
MRPDLDVVASLVPRGSRVLDLGCGDGTLLEHLVHHQGCRGTGVEIDPDAVLATIGRGVPVLALDIDRDLATFADTSYDVVVLSQTLQTTQHPGVVMREVRRIAPLTVVSAPNFGHWRHRLTLARGRMPVSRTLPYPWFETPNIHLATLADLERLIAAEGFAVQRRVLLDPAGRGRRWAPRPNLVAPGAAYLLRRLGTGGAVAG